MSERRSTPFWAMGVAAVRANVRPALCLQVAALALFLSYALWPAVHQAFDAVASLKLRYGWRFSMVSTATFGALVPWLLEPLQRGRRARAAPRELGLLLLFWAYKGLEVDALYRLQAHLLGAEVDVATVVTKVLADQFLYAPLIAIPGTVLYYHWKDHGRPWPANVTRFSQWFREQCLVILVLNWVVWLPSVIGIYCLPTALQLPVQNLVLCLWSLLLVFLTRAPGSRDGPVASAVTVA